MTGPFEEPEGATPLSADDRQGLKLPHIETRDELNEVEQANIDEAQQWLYRHRALNVLDDLFLKDLHWRMFNQVWTWAGTYRDRETNIGVAPNTIGARVRDLVRDVSAWIEFDHYVSVEVAARFHHQLVAIHPSPTATAAMPG